VILIGAAVRGILVPAIDLRAVALNVFLQVACLLTGLASLGVDLAAFSKVAPLADLRGDIREETVMELGLLLFEPFLLFVQIFFLLAEQGVKVLGR